MVLRLPENFATSAVQKEDHFVKLLGHFGRWQFIIFASVFLVKLSSGYVQMAILFFTPSYSFWCEEFVDSNRTALNDTCYEDCARYGYNTSPFNNTIISQWDLVCERKWLASFTQMVLQFGILLGSFVFGFLSDRYGRKPNFLAAVSGLIIFSFAIPYSPDYITFTVLRFFLGLATAGTMVISFVIVMETIGPKYREFLGCLFQIPFIIGHLSVPLFAYYFRNWDSYAMALAVPSVIYLGYFFLLDESPRWLVNTGKLERATRIVTKAATLNNLPTSNIEESLKKISHDTQNQNSDPKANYGDLFGEALWLKTVSCCFVWLVNGLTFFGFNQYISQTSPDPFASVAAAGAIQIPSNFISILLLSFYGRKITTAVFLSLGGLCILTLGCVSNTFWVTLTLGTLGVSCAAVVATTNYIYTSELFPTVVRNMGIGACSTAMRVGSMIAPFVANLSTTAEWLPTVIFGLSPIAAGLVILLLPETKGKALPDSIEDVKTGD